jgi:ABC-2 type transport system ATP-binding protein
VKGENQLNMLQISGVNKSFDSFHAVTDLSFTVSRGQVYGLLGPNGAGKTTTIRMVMQILLPDSGTIELFGKPLSPGLNDKIGYLPEERGLYRKMKVLDTVVFFGEMKGLPRAEAVKRGARWIERFELGEWRGKKVEELSKGMQQKVQFICTILHRPDLLILDEPFTGLDPVNVGMIKDVMLELKRDGSTVIFSTHQMEQVEKLCDSICLIHKGRNVLSGTLSDVKNRFGSHRIQMQYQGNARFLKDPSLVEGFDDYGQYVEIRLSPKAGSQDVLKRAAEEVTVNRFEIAEPSLNEIFIKTVQSRGEDRE